MLGSLFEQSILIDQNQSVYTLQVTLRKGLTRTIPVSCLENHRPVCQSTEVSPHVYLDYRYLLIFWIALEDSSPSRIDVPVYYEDAMGEQEKTGWHAILLPHEIVGSMHSFPHMDLMSRLIGDPGVSRWQHIYYAWRVEISQKGTMRPFELGYSIL